MICICLQIQIANKLQLLSYSDRIPYQSQQVLDRSQIIEITLFQERVDGLEQLSCGHLLVGILQKRHNEEQLSIDTWSAGRLQQKRILEFDGGSFDRGCKSELASQAMVIFGGVKVFVTLHSQFPFYSRIPMVFDGIVCSAWQELGYHRPFVPMPQILNCLLSVSVDDDLVLLFGPFVLTDIRIEMIVPSLSALFSDATGKLLGNKTPVLWSMLLYQSQHEFVLLFCLARKSITQGPLTREGLSTFCHLCRHCTSVLFYKNEAIFFQFLAPYYQTSCWSLTSYQAVHQCFWGCVGSKELADFLKCKC